ncbi:EamA family transporter [uncultured Vagococcus sp.]|uniref:EamA family transporter n=1 Tax=uncultured Vagococcus sp. TaxID=189676 RepID=UPI0028D6EADE|nr:EamA family transporter [uncultured Vagococcus sp.]
MNWFIGFFLLLTTTLTGSIGALYLKKAMNQMSELSVANVLRSGAAYLGLFFYMLSAVTNIILLDAFEYSVVFPMTSLSYVWTAMISVFVFREQLTRNKLIAITLIIIGVFVLSQ